MNNDRQHRLEPATINWDPEGQPLANAYQDVYFSRSNGLAETRYVFLEHNHLPTRWHTLPEGARFCIAETGFGTGLNFLATWQAWTENAPAKARLHFISVEKHPLSAKDLGRALALWPELEPQARALLAQYPPPCQGFHQLAFDAGRIQLTLLYGEAAECFAQLDGRVDAWFLDGFAPAKNPAMWSAPLFEQIARLSSDNATFSTFTAAGAVRRGLQAAGFTVEKVPGFGHKREMLRGRRTDAAAAVAHWAQRPAVTPSRHALVIGAGIAGASAAYALARRGLSVTVLDAGNGPASGASGNPQGILYTKLPATPTQESRIHLSGYLFSLRLLKTALGASSPDWSSCGLLQLAGDTAAAQRHEQLIARGHYPDELVRQVSRAQAETLAGVALAQPGLYFPDGGWVHPPALCRALLAHENIQCRYGISVDRLIKQEHGGWALYDAAGEVIEQAPLVVVATAAEARRLAPLDTLPLKPIRGQVSHFNAPPGPALKTVLCGKGYIAPPRGQRYCFGATFDLHSQETAVRAEDHRHNLDRVQELCPDLGAHLAATADDQRRGRVGFRCSSPDYLPLAGAVVDHDAFIDQYAALRRDAKATVEGSPPHLPGLFVSLGHGSKGLTTAPLCGELVAALACGDPLPLEQRLAQALNPARFLFKNLSRRTI
ncbi:bifunctional tRNA (5-methylaminomethyl-2-thiouridine)(34)-methyltransferase MnmD/FAD-dependent 5-carboxymethylaminomethyl-2-thiouridine(34) oxidoreductase MnmC [Motiliproteus sp. SC1-56]|uniref:bifunctional tRNA (5-methylaminomethyl-2-thiouridine)(34)-methyltransferase MnmD/FAD-dependent 5-carboxymethylaminomethyl-2-thiouridine(34) oxidoreductase MnmC n=1 Tax=Motiliproteus sp. SC1-56 TaxID=2799565 RepID=UPI001A8F8B57|nr:bifunctional tRNA (5-methylaminomethyl-2-thiouridine)(34)-methyltransferase MnmD/FAD-dependent 5-carboxymethylaminomethyl-2-thiouridine(34) oxidoreductase MnmC [Motiliproteus sp. SC1-56]